ncbi:MAG TPA: DUF6438 domain-containing protein [Candidatus Binatia bacterium]|jgi:hypothetical protein
MNSKRLGSLTLFFFATIWTSTGHTGELRDFYNKVHGDYQPTKFEILKVLTPEEAEALGPHITEIGIERDGCRGTCPIFTFIVKSDGTFRYTGERYVQHIGTYTGKVSMWDFNLLAEFIKDAGYMQLEDHYALAATDLPAAFTTVVMNGKRKIIYNYGDAAPRRLWAIQELIDSLLVHADWGNKLVTQPESK